MTEDENRRLLEDTLAAAQAVESIQRSRQASVGNGGSANININAGGIGVAAALVACALMIGLNAMLILGFNDMNRRVDRMQDHLNAIYMQAPYLKQAEEAK